MPVKRLYILRHAKSSWRDATLADEARPLNKRGQRDAPRMGAALAPRVSPLRFAVSPALRAQLTFDGLCAGWPGLSRDHCRTEPALYTFDVEDLLVWIADQSDALEYLAVIGHNPALTDLINQLVGVGTLENLPTAGWVELCVSAHSWRDAAAGQATATLEFSLFPRELADPRPALEA